MGKICIVVSVPESGLQVVLDAIAAAGGGQVGEYTRCSFTVTGVGRFKPSAAANPHIGANETINQVEEYRVETWCERSQAKAVAAAIRAAHPYEEPVIYLLPLLDEAEL